MFSFCSEKHALYQEDFVNYIFGNRVAKDYKLQGKQCSYDSDICSLWLFETDVESEQCFVVVPSLFNSSEILFFNEEQNYIEYLQQFGKVYLIEWLEAIRPMSLSDYADLVVRGLQFVKNTTTCRINLVGHCIGGNLAILSALKFRCINSLTLLKILIIINQICNMTTLGYYNCRIF